MKDYDTKLKAMKKAGSILATVLSELKDQCKPGITTEKLNKYAEKRIKELGGTLSFKGYDGFPAALCTSLNEDLVHCVPGKRKLRDGDVISLDLGVGIDGYHTDSAITVAVGKVSDDAKKLLKVTRDSLKEGIKQAKIGNTTNDIARAVQKYVESHGLAVIRDLVGHGISTEVHEPPYVPNFQTPGPHPKLTEGQTIAVEPMVSLKSPKLTRSEDGYGYAMADGKIGAHFEHTIIILKDGPRVLTKK